MNAINPLLFSVRKAFTLVELLVVVIIIAVLVGLTLLAVSSAASAAKVERTRATVLKIDAAIQQIYAEYDTKLVRIRNRINRQYAGVDLPEEERYKIALHFVRDLMRMEMPQSWAEVYNSASPKNPKDKLPPIPYNGKQTAEPPVFDYYLQAYKKVHAAGKKPGRAALLFLIVQNLNPEALEQFHASEIKDTDGDGLPEFVDAWGNPIQFLRSAPAFPDSDLQPDVLKLANFSPSSNMQANGSRWKNPDKSFQDAFAQAAASYPDPLDDHHVSDGWFLYPLVYSAGPDGHYDLTSEETDADDNPVSPTTGSEGILDPFQFPYGMPGNDGSRKLQHDDNIHNHRRSKSF